MLGSFLDAVWGKGTAATNTLYAQAGELKNLLLNSFSLFYDYNFIFCIYIYINYDNIITLEYIFIGGLSVILLAFEGSEALKSISRKVINTILALGVKVLAYSSNIHNGSQRDGRSSNKVANRR